MSEVISIIEYGENDNVASVEIGKALTVDEFIAEARRRGINVDWS